LVGEGLWRKKVNLKRILKMKSEDMNKYNKDPFMGFVGFEEVLSVVLEPMVLEPMVLEPMVLEMGFEDLCLEPIVYIALKKIEIRRRVKKVKVEKEKKVERVKRVKREKKVERVKRVK